MEILEKDIYEASQKVKELKMEISKKVFWQDDLIEKTIICLIWGWHILLEWMPWLAKTLTISTLSKCVDLGFNRIQFTPDLLPSDLIWTEIFNIKNSSFDIKKWPIFNNFILANKIKKYSVYEIAKDALWIIGRQPKILKFDNVLFVKKREFTSFFKYRKIIFYVNSSTNIIDIRGSNPTDDKFLNIIKDILIKYEFGIDLYDKLHSIRNNLIDDSLYYGEPVIKGVDNIKIIERLIKEILWFEKTYFLKRIHYICV